MISFLFDSFRLILLCFCLRGNGRCLRASLLLISLLFGSLLLLRFVRLSTFSQGQRVSVWWTDDAIFNDGSIAWLDSRVFVIDYEASETCTHPISTTFVASPDAVSSYLALAPAPPPQPPAPAPQPGPQLLPAPAPRSLRWSSAPCSDPNCSVASVNGVHPGLCLFPPPPPGRRNSL